MSGISNNISVNNQSILIDYGTVVNELTNVMLLNSTTLEPGLITTSTFPNVIWTDSYNISDYIPVISGQMIKTIAAVGPTGYVITAYQSESQESIVQSACVLGQSEEVKTYVVPNGINYVRISNSVNQRTNDRAIFYVKNYVSDFVKTLTKNFSFKTNIPMVDGVIILSSYPNVTYSDSYSTTEYIPVFKDEIYIINAICG